jgi:hypothetical protein
VLSVRVSPAPRIVFSTETELIVMLAELHGHERGTDLLGAMSKTVLFMISTWFTSDISDIILN